MRRLRALMSLCALAACLLASPACFRPDPERFEAEIEAWETADLESPPPANAIVFVGSSSIGYWDTVALDLAPLTIIQRSFGGSWMRDAVHYADRIVTAYDPRAVVLYEGDNDIGFGRLYPRNLLRDYQAFVDRVHAELPEARIYFLAIKPSIARWNQWPRMKEANSLIEAATENDDRLFFIDVATPLLGPNGGPPPESLFIEDRLHLNPDGYAIWTDIVRPVLYEHELLYE